MLRGVHLQWNDRTASAMISAMLRRIAATSNTSRRRSDRGLFLQLHNKHGTHINPLNPELNPICYLLALLAHHFLHVSRIMVNSLPLRILMSYIYIYIYIYIYVYMERIFLMFLDHTQRRTTVGRTPLDE